jgi:hypothetical protein
MRNKQAATTGQNDDFFRYNPVPARRPNEAVFAETGSGNYNYNPPATSITSNTVTDTSIPTTIPTARFTPLRRPSEPVILEPPYLHRQTSHQSDLELASTSSNPTTSGRNRSEPSGNVDIRALAREVAAVLYQNPAKSYTDPHGRLSVQNNNDDDANTSQLNHQQPPPNYRSVTGGTSSIGSPGKASHS